MLEALILQQGNYEITVAVCCFQPLFLFSGKKETDIINMTYSCRVRHARIKTEREKL